MGAAIDAIGDTGKILRHNPLIVPVGIGVNVVGGLITLVVSFVLGLIPLFGPLLAPVVQGVFAAVMVTGLLGMAYAGRNGNGNLDAFMSSVQNGFLSYLGAFLLLMTVSFVVTFVLFLVFIFTVGFGAAGISEAGGGASAFARVGLMIALMFLVVMFVFALVGFVIQFFDIAIVADDATALSSFSKSFDLVTRAPLSVLGYTALRALIVGSVVGIPYVIVLVLGAGVESLAGSTASGLGQGFGLVTIVLLGIWVLVIGPLGFIVNFTYHAAFYNRHQALGNV